MQPATVLSQKEIQRIARHLAAITAIVAGLNHAAAPAPKVRRRRRSTAGATVTDRLRHAIQTSPPAPPTVPKRRGRPPKAPAEPAPDSPDE